MKRSVLATLLTVLICSTTAFCETVESDIAMVPGEMFSRTAKGETGISYVVYVPTSFTAKEPPPVIIAFSPGGSGKGILNPMKESAEKAGWILIGSDKLRNGMKNDVLAHKMEDELLEDIFSKIPHDSRRIYLAGFSGGAMRAYGISARREERIAGIIAYGGWLGGKEHMDAPYCKYMAIAMANGVNDGGARAWTVRDTDALEERDCEVKHFLFPGEHGIAPADVTDDCIKWLERDWKRHGSKKP